MMGMDDKLDIFQFDEPSDEVAGVFSMAAMDTPSSVTYSLREHSARITSFQSEKELRGEGFGGQEWWKVFAATTGLFLTRGDHYVVLAASSPISVIPANAVYRVVKHRAQRDDQNTQHHDSFVIEYDESATLRWRSIEQPALSSTLPLTD